MENKGYPNPRMALDTEINTLLNVKTNISGDFQVM